MKKSIVHDTGFHLRQNAFVNRPEQSLHIEYLGISVILSSFDKIE